MPIVVLREIPARFAYPVDGPLTYERGDLDGREAYARRALRAGLSHAYGMLQSARFSARSRSERARALAEAGTWRTYAGIFVDELRFIERMRERAIACSTHLSAPMPTPGTCESACASGAGNAERLDSPTAPPTTPSSLQNEKTAAAAYQAPRRSEVSYL